MRIGIEAQRLFRKNKHGMDIVALELIKALQKTDTCNQYFVFVKADQDSSCITPTENFEIITTRKYPYLWWEQVVLRKLSKKYRLDLLHCTCNTAPIALSVPLVVTIHDIIYLERINLRKGSWYQIFGNLYRRGVVPLIARTTKKVITVSEYEKEVIKKKFPNLDLVAIYNGLQDSFVKITDPEILQDVKEQYRLPNEFILFIGNTDPKKNLIGVLRAYSILVNKGQPIPKLVVLDIKESFLEKMILKINPELKNHIVISGYVPNYQLPAIYSLATLFMYPSLRESFGIPLLEAMACGTPIITSSTSSMPEVVEDAALLVNPLHPEQIANAIETLLTDSAARARLVANGYERVKTFNWLNNAKQTLSIYIEVFNKKE
ncbi:MAG TPA: glycosyltransferase family 1 protein [Cyclobacteriaceae bacterium]|nr:glycosyltransferase family 1 protein [Cyclobacteriaceae bacterium]HRF35132.1 glycosyltransferase family 1 protein [Cyclobacteriaceae bacterium]